MAIQSEGGLIAGAREMRSLNENVENFSRPMEARSLNQIFDELSFGEEHIGD